MERDDFWQIVESARAEVGDTVTPEGADAVAEELVERLTKLSPHESVTRNTIVEFQIVLNQLRRESYRWDLWDAAYVINGGCSDDSFEDFRDWLLAQGRTVWEKALSDPDSLADVVHAGLGPLYCEAMWHVAADAFERVTGRRHGLAEALPVTRPQGEPLGERLDEEEVGTRLPRLSAIEFSADRDEGYDDEEIEALLARQFARERPALQEKLDVYRNDLLARCSGLTGDQLKEKPLPPSAISLLGLVRHMTRVERAWLWPHSASTRMATGSCAGDGPDFDVENVDAVAELEAFSRQIQASWDVTHARGGMIDPSDRDARWRLLDVVAEYGRHIGHADLVRQRIDGFVTG
ncbi:MAG TPA: DUF4240 domain-containing protein [Cryptosporangiaceae bacterium]|nr:DUF4240 domain-containing protein [Cryptosporangiaceae bacterium]